MTCDTSTLLAEAACFSCLSPGMLALVQAQLLCNISNSLSSGGVTQQVTCGDGAPTTAPGSGCGIYYDTTNDAVYIYRGGAWVLKV